MTPNTKQTTHTDEEPDTAPNTTGNDDLDTDEMSAAAVQVTSQDGNDERGTPVEFMRLLMAAIGGLFDLDPCSGAEPQAYAKNRFTKEDNGLAQSWAGHDTVYVNPPYSELKKWLKKVVREATRDSPDSPDLIMSLLPVNTSTQWFQKYAAKADYLCLIEGRLTFNGTDQNAPFASMVVVFGDPSDSVLETLNDLGATYTRTEIEEASRQSRLDELIEADGGISTVDAGQMAPAPGMNPAESRGQTIRDLSRAAPAVPQGTIDLYDLCIGDRMYIEFDTRTMGFPRNVPESIHARVEAGEPATERLTQTPREWDTVTLVDPDTDAWVVLCQNPENKNIIKCSVSADSVEWEDVSIDTLQRLSSNYRPAIEPYGNGTSYIC